MNFDLLRILEPSKKQDSGFLPTFSKMQEARVLLTILSASCYRLPASKSATWDVAVLLERTQEAESREPGPLS
jgi:hypothetical protein